MGVHQRVSAQVNKGVVVALLLAVSGVLIAAVDGRSGARTATEAKAKIEASIFAYDGKDFVRTQTTLVTEEGKSAVNTRLDHGTAAYEALTQKHSYSGEATVFGRKYAANYAPLTDKDGGLTGALFVGVAQ